MHLYGPSTSKKMEFSLLYSHFFRFTIGIGRLNCSSYSCLSFSVTFVVGLHSAIIDSNNVSSRFVHSATVQALQRKPLQYKS